MTQFLIVPATPAHGEELARNARDFVKDEAWAMFARDASYAIAQSLEQAVESYTWLADGQVGFIAGVSQRSMLDPTAVIWVSTTELVARYRVAFIRACKQLLAAVEARHPDIETWIDARAGVSLAWARHFDFEMHPAEPFGPAALPFHKFTKRPDHGV